jgi:hypothetical protein
VGDADQRFWLFNPSTPFEFATAYREMPNGKATADADDWQIPH